MTKLIKNCHFSW